MATKTARFSSRILASAGLAVNHSSNYVSRDPFGVTVPINTPHYERPMAFAAAPAAPVQMAVATGTVAGTFCQCIGSGTWLNGQPAAMMRFSTSTSGVGNNVLRLGVGSNWGLNAFNTGSAPIAGSVTGVVQWDIGTQAGDLGGANKALGNRVDLLRGAGAGNGEDANLLHVPVSATIADGLVLVWCAVSRWNSTDWGLGPVSSALCQYDVTTATWRRVLLLPDNGTLLNRGSQWNNGMWTSPTKGATRPTEVWAGFVDYLFNSSSTDVHSCVLMRATRPDPGSVAWTVQAVEVLRTTATAANQHLHSAIVTDLGVVICQGHRGDATVILLEWTTPWAWPTGSGAASPSDGVSQNGWTTRINFSGKRGSAATVRRHNQYMAVAPLGRNNRDFVCAVDIGSDPLVRMTMPTVSTNKPRFEALRAGRGASFGASPLTYEVYGLTVDDYHAPKRWVSMKVGFDSAGVVMPGGTFGTGKWALNNPSNKIIYSRDGINWAQLYANTAGIFREPKCVGNQVFFTTVSGGNTVMFAVDMPPITVGRPMTVAASNNNFAIVTPDITSVAANNSCTDVTATYTNPNAIANGLTIPPCPSPNAVFYGVCTETGATGTIANLGVTTVGLTTYTFPQARPRIVVWVYVIPASEPFVNDTTAPFDSPNLDMTLRIVRRDGAALDNTFQDCVADDSQGGGWVKYVLSPDVAAWTSFPKRFALTVLSNQSGPRPASLLVSIESCCCGNTNATAALQLTEFPIKPIPALPSANTTPVSTFSDTIETVGLGCGSSWTVLWAGQIPDDGPDQYTYLTRPSGRRLFHLAQAAGTNAQGVNQLTRISVEFDVANRRFSFTDGTNTRVLPAVGGQEFELGRAAQIGIGISRAVGGTMTFAAFVGGCQVATDTVTWATPVVTPTKVVHADESLGVVEPHLLHGVYCDDSVAMNVSQLTTALQNLANLIPSATAQPFQIL